MRYVANNKMFYQNVSVTYVLHILLVVALEWESFYSLENTNQKNKYVKCVNMLRCTRGLTAS